MLQSGPWKQKPSISDSKSTGIAGETALTSWNAMWTEEIWFLPPHVKTSWEI